METGVHVWDEGTVTKESREKVFKCTTCDAIQTQVLDKLESCDGRSDCPGKEFIDYYEAGHWAHDGMANAVRNGLMKGEGDGAFNPEGDLTRAMLVTILWRYAGGEDVGETVSQSRL